MKRFRMPFSDWSWDQVVLIMGPVLLSIVLVVLYAAGLLPIDLLWLVSVIALVNIAGDVAFAVKSERGVRLGRVPLCNDMVGSRAVAEESFSPEDGRHRGTVALAGEKWRAVSDERIEAGAPVRVVGRRGLVLDVAPEAGAAAAAHDG